MNIYQFYISDELMEACTSVGRSIWHQLSLQACRCCYLIYWCVCFSFIDTLEPIEPTEQYKSVCYMLC